MSFITKRKVASLVTASTIFGTMAVAAVLIPPWRRVRPDGFMRDGINLTAAQINGRRHGSSTRPAATSASTTRRASPTPTSTGLDYYGVVVNGGNVDTTNSKVHQIGESPFDGMQRGRAILYINGATGTISGNKVYAFQKNGIEVAA